MLNVDLVGHRKPEIRIIRVIRVQKPRTPGRLYSIRTSDCKITKSPLHGWDKSFELMLDVEC